MKWLFLIPVFFLLLTSAVSAQTVGIGVQPSIVDPVRLTNLEHRTYLPIKLWNEGNTDAIFKITLEGSLSEFVLTDCSEPSEYWCPDDEFLIPSKTNRIDDYTEIKMLFIKKTSGTIDFWTGSYINAEAINVTKGMVAVRPRVKVRIHLIQTDTENPEPPPSVTPPSQEDFGPADLTTTTTTTTPSDGTPEINATNEKNPETTTTTQEGEGINIVAGEEGFLSGFNPLYLLILIPFGIIGLAVAVIKWY